MIKNFKEFSHLLDEQKRIHETKVFHEEDSYEKYGDGSDYEGYTSWLDFWEQHSKSNLSDIKKCPCCGETMTDPDGAHVVDSNGNKYITPTCSSCNSKAAQNEEFRCKPFFVQDKHLVDFDWEAVKKLRKS